MSQTIPMIYLSVFQHFVFITFCQPSLAVSCQVTIVRLQTIKIGDLGLNVQYVRFCHQLTANISINSFTFSFSHNFVYKKLESAL